MININSEENILTTSKRFAAVCLAIATFLLSSCATQRTAKTAGDQVAPEASSGFRHVELARTKQFMVACAHPLASDCGKEILARGGSALDAAVGIQAMLNLVEPQSSGIGGGGFLLYYDAKTNQVIGYDGRETAPASATPDLFLDGSGKPLAFFEAVVGGRSVGTPGVLRMLELAHNRHGKQPWSTLFAEPIARAQNGFTVTPRMNKMITGDAHLMTQPAARKAFYDAAGQPIAVGATYASPELAQSFRTIAENGADAFYRGPLAKRIVDVVNNHENPGRLQAIDLSNYEPKVRKPIEISYRGYRICALPPPSGGLPTLQILKLLEPFDLGDDPQSTQFLHLLAEAERLAYADRGRYMADADFVNVPVTGLLDSDYLKKRSALINPKRATPNAAPGLPDGATAGLIDGASLNQPSTSHFVVADPDGNIACMTSSIENAFGSRVMVGGFLLNNQLTDFSFKPTDNDNRPIANAVAPEKRPRSSMTPIIVFDKNNKPILALGSPGGSRIIGYVAQTLIHVLDFGMDVQQAIDLPHVINRNGNTEIEDHPDHKTTVNRLVKELTVRGHTVTKKNQTSGLHAIAIDANGLTGGADPRREGTAIGK